MDNTTKKLLMLIKDNKITDKEYHLLLSAITKPSKYFTLFNFLINPYKTQAARYFLVIGFINYLILGVLGQIFKIHFPGVIGFETFKGTHSYTTKQIILELLISLLIYSFIVYASVTILKAGKLRLLDLISFYFIPKIPYTLLGVLCLIFYLVDPSLILGLSKLTTIRFKVLNLIISFVCSLFYVWELTLYFNAYKEISGLRNNKLWLSSVITFILANATLYVIDNSFINLLSINSHE